MVDHYKKHSHHYQQNLKINKNHFRCQWSLLQWRHCWIFSFSHSPSTLQQASLFSSLSSSVIFFYQVKVMTNMNLEVFFIFIFYIFFISIYAIATRLICLLHSYQFRAFEFHLEAQNRHTHKQTKKTKKILYSIGSLVLLWDFRSYMILRFGPGSHTDFILVKLQVRSMMFQVCKIFVFKLGY